MAHSINEEPTHMVLSMLGMWSTHRSELIIGYRTDNEEDVPGPVTINQFGNMGIVCTTSKLHDTHTMLPLSLHRKFSE